MARKRKSKRIPGWLIAVTHQHAEFEAKRELSRQGFEAEFPMYRTAVNRHGMRHSVPLFEGYCFVRECGDGYGSIRGTRGVSHLLMSCERPAILADDELQFFLSISVDNQGYYQDPVMRLLKVGDTLVPRSGRFAGVEGQLTSLNADGRTKMLFKLLGRDVVTEEYKVGALA